MDSPNDFHYVESTAEDSSALFLLWKKSFLVQANMNYVRPALHRLPCHIVPVKDVQQS